MDDDAAILVFAALSHGRRLGIFKLLSRIGDQGICAGDIADTLAVPPSSLSFHLTQLEQSGLINSRRERRQIFYSASLDQLAQLIGYLVSEGESNDSAFRTKLVSHLAHRSEPIAETATFKS